MAIGMYIRQNSYLPLQNYVVVSLNVNYFNEIHAAFFISNTLQATPASDLMKF